MAVAGCGGSSSSTTSAPPRSTVAQATVTTVTVTERRPAHPAVAKRRPPRAGNTKLHATVYNTRASGKQSGGRSIGAVAKLSSSGQNPCTFVSTAEAQAIVHAQVLRQIEASQGPTCLFELKGAEPSITLAVAPINVSRELAQMKTKPTQLSIGGHTAYCGTLGSSLLFLELGGGRVLKVAAPCAMAEALASTALPRIQA